MIYALINDSKTEATPNSRGTCPFCKLEMIPKCGPIVTWHWAHKKKDICDSWKNQETEWHRNWKSVFTKDKIEVIIYKNNQKHIADVITTSNRVIELQNSPISRDTIAIREQFYGSEMIWIINGKRFEDTFNINSSNNQIYDDYSPEFEYYAKLHGFTPNYKPSADSRTQLQFTWKRPHTSWQNSKCETYVDFGYENLFCITKGIGLNVGQGYEISKLEFLNSHGGDISMLHKIVLPK